MTRSIAVALVHYPVLDRQGQTVTTSITNLDLHDIARSAYTYGLKALYVVQPVSAQRELVRRIKQHWVEGSGARRIPDRRTALELLVSVESLEQAKAALEVGRGVEIWATSARVQAASVSHGFARQRLQQAGPDVLLVFGTGWGLASEIVEKADQVLCPIASPRADGYNHLSVRAAAAIIFDRLLSQQR